MRPAHSGFPAADLLSARSGHILALVAAGRSLLRESEMKTMTYLNITHAPAATGLSGLIANLRDGIATTIRRNRVRHQIRTELEAMTDRELADIGIVRYMIEEIATEAAARA
jgi:uncharacterized protein YjiS (DUF1127 family)